MPRNTTGWGEEVPKPQPVVPERFPENYTQLTRAQIQCALDYYAAHPARVDEDIERNERAYAEAHGLP